MQKANVRILFTSDIHGSLNNIQYANNQAANYGLVKAATYLKQNHNQETVIIDLGDSIQGSPMLYYHQMHRHEYENPVAQLLNEIKYDYFIPGNHDFNFGADYLKMFVKELHAKTLCANILDLQGEPAFKNKYDIKTFENGLKIAFIGVTTEYIPNWEQPHHIKDLVFQNVIDSLTLTIQEIQDKDPVDSYVVLYHGGFEKDLDSFQDYVRDTGENRGSKILETFPFIDVLLTGHQHRSLCQEVGKVTVLQPSFNARQIGQVDLSFEKEEVWRLSNKQAKLIEVGPIPVDKRCQELIEPLEKMTQAYLDQPIGFVPNNDLWIDNLFQARLKKHKIVTLINQVQLLYSQAEISCTSLGNNITGFEKEISIRHVLSTYIYPNTLTVLEITGEKLRLALEKNAEYFVIENNQIVANPRFSFPKLEHYNYDMFDGIEYTFNISKPFGKRVERLTYQNKPVRDDDVFTLVMNNYRATGGGEFEMYRGLPIVREIQTDISYLLIQYIKQTKNIVVPETNNIKIYF